MNVLCSCARQIAKWRQYAETAAGWTEQQQKGEHIDSVDNVEEAFMMYAKSIRRTFEPLTYPVYKQYIL